MIAHRRVKPLDRGKEPADRRDLLQGHLFARMRWMGISMLILAGGFFLVSCSDKIEPGTVSPAVPETVKARVAVAQYAAQPFIYEAVGTITARTASTLSGKLMGTIKAVNVEEGDWVHQGEALVVIDARQVTAQLQQAQAGLAEARRAEASARSARDAARARVDLAKATYDRYKNLMAEDSASPQEFDEVASQYRQAQASLTQTTAMLEASGHRVQQAEAAVAGASVGKKDAVILAPYDGKVTSKMVDVGDLASPGTPLLTLEKADVYCVDLVLPERHIRSVSLDQEVTVVVPALGDRQVVGRIGRIVPAADQKTRSFLIKVALPDGTEVKSGMFARVSVPIGEAGMILIPKTAIVNKGQLTGVFMIDEQETAHFRLLRTGRSIGDAVEVVSGMKDGDRYVVEPPLTMANGSKVEGSS